ncbi:unnamed protein product [Gordionus sp. m RMFG-2023]
MSNLGSWNHLPACVIDVGTGYTKMGFAGNSEPSFILPTAVAIREGPFPAPSAPAYSKEGGSGGSAQAPLASCIIEDLDFHIGDRALLAGGPAGAGAYSLKYPVRHGLVADWDLMEKFLQRCMFGLLRVQPEDHHFLMTEPPLNPPENREYLAEIVFETFNAPGLYIAVQAVLALAASWTSKTVAKRTMTGTVIDSGDGVTHVIPVADGFAIGSCVKHVPIAGRDITGFVQQLLRDRNETANVPPEQSLETARLVKEKMGYVCPDMCREFNKYDTDPKSWIKQFKGINNVTRRPFVIDVGYERFLGPEIFFRPEMWSPDHRESLSSVVDGVIQSCPIDARRPLYEHVVLSGGSTMFKGNKEREKKKLTKYINFASFNKFPKIITKDLGRRLQRDLKRSVDARLKQYAEAGSVKEGGSGGIVPRPIDVQVVTHHMQRHVKSN